MNECKYFLILLLIMFYASCKENSAKKTGNNKVNSAIQAITEIDSTTQENKLVFHNEIIDIPFYTYDFSEINEIKVVNFKQQEYDYTNIDNSYPSITFLDEELKAKDVILRPKNLNYKSNFEIIYSKVGSLINSRGFRIYDNKNDFLSFNYVCGGGVDRIEITKTDKNGVKNIGWLTKGGCGSPNKIRFINGSVYSFSNREFISKVSSNELKYFIESWIRIEIDENAKFKLTLLNVKEDKNKNLNSEINTLKSSQIQVGKKIIEVQDIIKTILKDNTKTKNEINEYKRANNISSFSNAISHSFIKMSLLSYQENIAVIDALNKQGTSLFDSYNEIRFLVKKVTRDDNIKSVLGEEQLTKLIESLKTSNEKYQTIVNTEIKIGSISAEKQTSLETIWNERIK